MDVRKRNKACVKCDADEWKPNGAKYWRCHPCYVARKAKYYQENKEKVDTYNRRWTEDNRETSRTIKKKYRDANPEVCRAMSTKWRKANNGKVREYVQFRRALLKNATPSWADRKEMQYVHRLASERGLVVDHIVPINNPLVCGLNTEQNLRCIPEKLNLHKGNRYWPDMPNRGTGGRKKK